MTTIKLIFLFYDYSALGRTLPGYFAVDFYYISVLLELLAVSSYALMLIIYYCL